MNRTFLFLAAVAIGSPAFADKVDEKLDDAQRDLNHGKRKASEDVLEARKLETGNTELVSMEADLRSRLGDDWTVKKSGNGYLATRVTPKKAENGFTKKVADQQRDFRSSHKDAQVTRNHDEVMLRGRIDDCGDAANAANDFAGIDGINKIFVDLSCTK